MYVSLNCREFRSSRFDRVCTQDTTVNGINIPKGMGINVSVYAIHHSPENWEDPEDFKPER